MLFVAYYRNTSGLRCALVALGMVLFTSSVRAAQGAPEINFWNIDRLAALDAGKLDLVDSRGGVLASLARDRLRTLDEVRRRLERASDLRVDVFLAADEQPYAFS